MAKSPAEQFREIAVELAIYSESLKAGRLELATLRSSVEKLEDRVSAVTTELAVLRQRLDEQQKHTEKWDTRLWGLVAILVGALLSLAAGLIVALVRK
ncbi:emp24/gp25L/p24 family protein [Fimbriiglobus ruber]|uniref:GOLD domain-containing protein n=1 Tax=Fimbriiglobus ruber TaxID=1908690 RepID=A0A225EDL1_9BACT|nr:emp24/gp25L/p24 family protein [Fimbriiglobus ruber]OWK47399.1 hypothetical protein FRUB_01098 [Fimbriiglobus ruber]